MSTAEVVGFTLVEVLVVLVIVSLALGMVVFAVTSRPMDHAVQTEADELASWIRVATTGAAEHSEMRILRYDLDAGGLVVWAVETPDEAPREILAHQVAPPVRIECLVRVRDEVLRADRGGIEVIVFPSGNCEAHLVTLTHEGVGSRTLEVNPITGDVLVFDGRRDYERVDPEELFGATAQE